MKRLLFILLFIVTNCAKEQESNQTIIAGKIMGEIPEKLEYTLPIDGINYFGFKNSVIPDSLGNFKIELPVETVSFVEFFNEFNSYGVIIAEPGITYSLLINTKDKDNRFHVESENHQGQNLYNKISENSILRGTGGFQSEGDKYLKDSIPSKIKQAISAKLETEIMSFKELLNANLISDNFYELVITDRKYYYAGTLSSVAYTNYVYNEIGKTTSLDKNEYETLWKNSFHTYPISNSDLIRSTWFYNYLQSFLWYKELVEDTEIKNNSNTKQEFPRTHHINTAKKYLSGKQLEYYYAAYIYFESLYQDFSKELITLFEVFKEDYPSSEFTPFIESEIIPIITFHKKQKEALNENIYFVENAENINSLKDAIKSLNANKVYIDVWATWCAPCKVEFKYNKELYGLLKSKNITMLYLSVDKDNKNEAWKDMIKYYELEGHHIRVNETFYNDLRNLRGRENSFYIPWHFITDGDGGILNLNANGPSEIKKLEKQLDE